MQRCKETKRAKQHKASKASISSHRAEKGMHQANQHRRDVFSQMVTPKQATRGMDATTKASGPKTNKHKPTEGTKHGKNLDLAKQTWM